MIRIVDAVARWLAGAPIDTGPEPRLPPGVEVRRSRLVPLLGGHLSGMGRAAAAVTLGRTILVEPSVRPDPRLIRHELAHVEQWTRRPFTFPLRYVVAHIRFGYANNPYEREARAAERPSSPGEAS